MPAYSTKRSLSVGFRNMSICLVEIIRKLLSVDKALEVYQSLYWSIKTLANRCSTFRRLSHDASHGL